MNWKSFITVNEDSFITAIVLEFLFPNHLPPSPNFPTFI